MHSNVGPDLSSFLLYFLFILTLPSLLAKTSLQNFFLGGPPPAFRGPHIISSHLPAFTLLNFLSSCCDASPLQRLWREKKT